LLLAQQDEATAENTYRLAFKQYVVDLYTAFISIKEASALSPTVLGLVPPQHMLLEKHSSAKRLKVHRASAKRHSA
jgi:hypothetical protein